MDLVKLLHRKDFTPFLVAQFLIAYVDSLLKNSVILSLAAHAANARYAGLWVNSAYVLFVLPYFLFSPLAGQLSDKFRKNQVLLVASFGMLAVCIGAAAALWTTNAFALLGVVFMLATIGTFFGPVKYGFVPEHLQEHELMAGNSLVGATTFLGILLGVVSSGFLSDQILGTGLFGVLACIFAISLCKLLPASTPAAPDIEISTKVVRDLRSLARLALANKTVFLSILGLAWYWFYSVTVIAQIPALSRHFFGAYETMTTIPLGSYTMSISVSALPTVLLGVYAISLGIGALLCSMLSRGEIELGLVPLGAVGLTIFCADLYFADSAAAIWRMVADIAAVGLFSAFYYIPLYALIQDRTPIHVRSRTIAACNVISSFAMVTAALLCIVLFQLKFNVLDIFLATAAATAIIDFYIFAIIPEFVLRFLMWFLAWTFYSVKFENRDQLPREKGFIITTSQSATFSWLLITACSRRPVRFLVPDTLYYRPLYHWAYRILRAVPVLTNPENRSRNTPTIRRLMHERQEVGLFLNYKGVDEVQYKAAINQILDEAHLPVYPISVSYVERGTPQSHDSWHWLKFWYDITITVDAPITGASHSTAIEDRILSKLQA